MTSIAAAVITSITMPGDQNIKFVQTRPDIINPLVTYRSSSKLLISHDTTNPDFWKRMNSADSNGGWCWPTPIQGMLLRAALLAGEQAEEALKQWTDSVDLQQLDTGSCRLLPLLYRNLPAQNVEDALLEGCMEAYRTCFLENEVLLNTAAGLLNVFQQAGLATMVLKGSALIPLYYRDSGLRPMADCDLLVHVEDVPKAISLLGDCGWKPEYDDPKRRVLVAHSTPFADGAGRQVDLHWHVMWECWHADDDDAFWKRSVPVQIHNASTRALDPTDQLLHVCWHGARWDQTPPVRWIADAMMILRTASEEIDWTRLVAQARSRHLSLPLYDCLNYLRSALDAAIPSEIPRLLTDIPVFVNERLGYRIANDPFKPRTNLEILQALSYDLTWFLSSTRMRDWPIACARFLQDKWKIGRLREIPFVLSVRALRRLGKSP